MRVAHLILAHKNPAQLERLITALQHPSFFFYIHVDKKINIQPFNYLRRYKNVFFIRKRTKIYWADYGTIQATINGFEEILPLNYDYINVISAQDFPVKSPDYIYNFFSQNAGKEFITCLSVDHEWQEAAVRIKQYHLINFRIPGRFKLEKILNRILPERKFPLDFIMVGRANWFSLTNNAVKYILDFLKSHPSVTRFFKFSWGADEIIFSTVLYNSSFKNMIIDNLMYVDWSRRKAHPKILTSTDYNALINSEKLFARKFDADVDDEIFSMLEKTFQKSAS